jgi:hypothetical protein
MENEEYLVLTREGAEKLLPFYKEMENTRITEATTGKHYAIMKIRLVPASPIKREPLIKLLVENSISEAEANHRMEQEEDFSIAMFLIELQDFQPIGSRVECIRYVVDGDSGSLALGFGIVT